MSKKTNPLQILQTERLLTPEDFGEVLLTPQDFGRDTLEFADFAGEINNAGWDMQGDDACRITPDFYMTNADYVWKEINATHDKAILEIDRICAASIPVPLIWKELKFLNWSGISPLALEQQQQQMKLLRILRYEREKELRKTKFWVCTLVFFTLGVYMIALIYLLLKHL